MTDEEVVRALRKMQFDWALRWCQPGPLGCGCMGCANNSGKLAERGVTRDQWERALKAAFSEFLT